LTTGLPTGCGAGRPGPHPSPAIRYIVPVDYRLYRPGDFAALYAIEEACFQPPLRFPQPYMRKLVASRRGATWIAKEEEQMAGFAIAEWPNSKPPVAAYIATLEVAPEFRNRGIGGDLLRRLEASAQNAGAALMWLHVDAENAAAIRLYESHAYQCRGREEHYYASQRAALIYAKDLSDL
jgi:ribosomal protein S18 acetylase RimI-like enzyme